MTLITNSRARLVLAVGIIGVGLLLVMVGIIIAKQKSAPSGTNTAATNVQPATSKESAATVAAEPKKEQAKLADGVKTYENAKYGLSFQYPEKWRIEERDPAMTSLEHDKVELSVWILDTSAKSQSEAAVVTVSSKSIESVVADIESSVGSHANRSEQSVNSKKMLRFTIPQPGDVKREWYLYGNESKTFRVETILEKENISRNPTYMSDMNKLVNSLRLP